MIILQTKHPEEAGFSGYYAFRRKTFQKSFSASHLTHLMFTRGAQNALQHPVIEARERVDTLFTSGGSIARNLLSRGRFGGLQRWAPKTTCAMRLGPGGETGFRWSSSYPRRIRISPSSWCSRCVILRERPLFSPSALHSMRSAQDHISLPDTNSYLR